MTTQPGLIARLSQWIVGHRRTVLVAWVVLLVGALLASSAAGSHYSNSNSLAGTQSQRATDLLKRNFPAQAGDSDQIVFRTPQGSITDPAVRTRVSAMLAQVARLPHVSGVISPYSATGARQVSADGRIAFATVLFDERANSLPMSAAQKVISVADAVRSPQLQVELGGQAIEQTQRTSLGIASAVGLAAAIVILLITFGSVVAMGLPIVTALLGLGTAFGLIALGSHVLSMPDFSTQLAAMIGLGVGIDYALFVVTRFRENIRRGLDKDRAIVAAMDTAGRAVLFAGVTVIIALLGLYALGVSFLSGLGASSAIAVALTVLAAVTVLPSLLSRFGERVGRERRPPTRESLWSRWAVFVSRHPWPASLAGLAIMLAIAVPALSLRMGLSDAGNQPTSQTTRRAYDLLAEGFGKGFNGPLLVVAELPSAPPARSQADLASVRGALASTSDVASVSTARLGPQGTTAVFQLFPRSAPQEQATTDLVNRLRTGVLPPLSRTTSMTLLVGGVTATGIDFTNVLSSKLALFIAIVVLLAALLLLVVFRSVVIPLQAAVMNLLSIGSALGVTVAVFQYGWLGGLVGVKGGPIEPWLPVMLFAIVFGLSMDYEVFIVSRIREEWIRRGDAKAAVVQGIASTGRVITAAATIMICVFLSFVTGPERAIKLFGLSLASAVFLDAFVIRSLLLPAVLQLLGRRTWTLPAWLDRRLPHVGVGGEGGGDEDQPPEPTAALEPAFSEA